MLVDRTIPITAAGIGKVSPHTSLEEALAAFARVLAVVLATRLVTAHLNRTRLIRQVCFKNGQFVIATCAQVCCGFTL